jgi:tyrosinase
MGIGGEMAWVDVSPNDPIFFLHHAQVDRVWWKWQQQNPSARNFDYSGNLFPPVGSATLDDYMVFSGFAADLKVRDVMTTNTERLCYKY